VIHTNKKAQTIACALMYSLSATPVSAYAFRDDVPVS
jgi:hypothetical protein